MISEDSEIFFMQRRMEESSQSDERSCPVCRGLPRELFFRDSREFFRCPDCELVFVLPCRYLSLQEEKAVYDQHENSPDDFEYRKFLSRLFEPMLQRLHPNSNGLDFGSGPGPTLSVMFEEAGHKMEIYDPFYAPDITPLSQQYDFITASEVVEHMHQPTEELDRLWSCLKPGGLLGIMTKRVTDQSKFAGWHYKNDPTHVCFFSKKTFQWFAAHWNAVLTIAGNDVVLFRKSVECNDQ